MNREESLRRLAARRWRLAIVLTIAMLVAYFGFILLVAFDKPLMGQLVAGGRISVGIIIGAGVIVIAPILTGIYVRWANNTYDRGLAELRGRRDAEGPR